MKISKIIAGIVLLGGISVFVQSCTKAVPEKRTYHQEDLSEYRNQAMEWTQKIPEIAVYDKKNDRVITVDLNEKNFSFSDANDGWNFSDDSDVAWSSNSAGGGILFIGPGSFGGNTGGVIIAGNSALNVNHTFCFSASDEALGLDLFDFGGDFDGVSLVLGIAGNFEALAEGDVDEDSEFTDYFQGFALYIVYDNEASGEYEVLNWFQDLDMDPDYLGGGAFGYVIDFVEPGIYFTYDGTIVVTGGSMNFNGEFFGLFDFLLDFYGNDEDPEYGVVSGYGQMGCS